LDIPNPHFPFTEHRVIHEWPFLNQRHSLVSIQVSSPILSRKAVDHGPARPRTIAVFFETMSKRRKGFPSEMQVKRGVRIVHGTKELTEKLGRNDLCPCGSGKRFKKCCRNTGCF
jgi:hypothetical protein